jgi:hypothetical protein
MTAHRIFIVSALACAAAWLTKTVVIAALGGEQTSGGIVGVFWAVGMLALVVAAGSGVAAALRGKAGWLRGIAAVVAMPIAFVGLNVLDSVVKAAYPGDSWFRNELGLLLVGCALAATAILTGARALSTARASSIS